VAQAGHLALDAAVAPCLLDDHSRLALGCDAPTVFNAADVVTSFRKAAAGYAFRPHCYRTTPRYSPAPTRGRPRRACSLQAATDPTPHTTLVPSSRKPFTDDLAEPAQRPPRASNLRSHTLGCRPTPPALCSLDLWWEYATPDHELDRAFLAGELPLVEDRRLGSTDEHACQSPLSSIRSFGLSSRSGTCQGT
jgi:hypothetical protein